ncbi:MAG: Signaling protein with a GGDEF protein [uncultured bacterium]|nr:MAG: Signaling protein with a GGDEF protein [uncultured bacterium]OFW69347.1 MAG: hypothetical protein A2X70_07295 [Alphaproteobacteria bacterium GWC2_42_16]OFW74058.1 MAG: hypothetical protein A2Z80_07655 [Alphaproteobacteria bacterium GWA2_41_27]OFW83104.1 MAG: hypothetical protein A3E50_05745 [Alphaproteobacteria bacterium RIFCSPHIGHO2_12_FULL_42_100]OFW84588.1 MAG: hypothetical protein A2W06_07870 [Alphaproteobacteria bacterium RBG_16_42_14]OFW92021.1 MAG: hypothetical protein A3C41_067
MNLTSIDREELQAIVVQLEQALYNHLQWHNALIRVFACHLPCNLNDMHPQSYKKCLFGQWYYTAANKKLYKHPSFVSIGETHRQMHHLASELLSCVNVGQVIDSQNYDSFCNLVERLRLEISSLKREIELSLYTHDPLTGAINRVDMLPVLREIQSMDKRLSQNSSLIMIDLDLFKKVNDKFGHPVGDKVLQVIARFLMDNLRPYDKLFRYGGEEFLICLHNTSFKDCYDRIEILRDRLSKKQIDIGKRDPIYITASFGIAELDTQLPIEDAIEHADKALYAAKAAGRNCTRTWPN